MGSVGRVEEAFDLDATTADAVRLVPVRLREADAAIREPDVRDTFDFAPATFAILLSESAEVVNATTDRDHFNRLDRADNLKPHAHSSYARQRTRCNRMRPRQSGQPLRGRVQSQSLNNVRRTILY